MFNFSNYSAKSKYYGGDAIKDFVGLKRTRMYLF